MSSSLVLLPPAIVLILSLITKRISFALLCGIFTAAFITSHYIFFDSLILSFSRLWQETGIPNLIFWQGSFDNLYLFGFLLILGIIIALMSHSGGAQAYSTLINKYLHSPRSVETSSLFLSMCFMIDDYFSILTVGSLMRKIITKFKIPHVKIAFLVNTMGPTLCILLPITSWTAMILSQFANAGISNDLSSKPLLLADPFVVYTKTIPYIFYSFIVVASTIFVVRKRISFGAMHTHERIAQETGNLSGGKTALQDHLYEPKASTGTLLDFLIPIITLITLVCFCILYTGNYHMLGGINSLRQALTETNIFSSLFIASLITLLVTITFYFYDDKVEPKDLISIIQSGVHLMAQSVMILLLANVFSDLLRNDLHTGDYISAHLSHLIKVPFLPLLFFVISLVISTVTGSSWGTIALMIPLFIPIFAHVTHLTIPASNFHAYILYPTLGAILSGAVAGTHLSPLADNMLMSSFSSGAYHADHVKTQFLYVLPAIIASALAFTIVGFGSGYPQVAMLIIALLIGIAASILLLSYSQYLHQRKKKSHVSSHAHNHH